MQRLLVISLFQTFIELFFALNLELLLMLENGECTEFVEIFRGQTIFAQTY